MESSEKQISQKDYLKKYLSKNKGEKKKKKAKISSSSHLKRSVIIDDDLGLPSVASIDDEEFNLDYLGDEAPQVAGIVDERPLEIRAKESHASNKWKTLGEENESSIVNNLLERLGQSKDSTKKSELNGKNNLNDDKIESGKQTSGPDLSPPRAKTKKSKTHGDRGSISPPRKKYQNKVRCSDSDLSPPRGRSKRVSSNSDSDLSPPRNKIKTYKTKVSRNNSDSDISPPRNKNKVPGQTKRHIDNSDSDLSPPRRKNEFEPREIKHKLCDSGSSSFHKKKVHSTSDLSPHRRKEFSRHKTNTYNETMYRKQESKDSNKARYDDRKKRRYNSPSISDRKKRDSSSDLSPPRNRYEKGKMKQDDKSRSNSSKRKPTSSDSDLSPPRKGRHRSSDSDLSPPRKGRNEKYISGGETKKMDKTLDGKKAGLQNAKNLKEELRKLKETEDIAFSKLQANVSGKNASAIMRDRKTGKIRDLQKEKQEIIEKSAKQIEREKKYEKWGKGLKQIEDAEERLADVLHEMNKPLARYAGDDDLENMLKSREREGDPMLDYIRSKQAESISLDNTGKPKYQGHFMPNRFGIRPGHRWDGVDRSNGYEKSWFERQNARKAIQEEAYKWSTSDM